LLREENAELTVKLKESQDYARYKVHHHNRTQTAKDEFAKQVVKGLARIVELEKKLKDLTKVRRLVLPPLPVATSPCAVTPSMRQGLRELPVNTSSPVAVRTPPSPAK